MSPVLAARRRLTRLASACRSKFSSPIPPNLPSFSPRLLVNPPRRRMATVTTESLPGSYGSYKLLQSFPVKYAPVDVSKWRSEATGLTVVLARHSTPITNGYFTVASEIFDDTGRPHTLEHLVFLGSKSYPFKGVLDQLANRAGSNGTNAWTDTDHTAYTIATAGSAGFLKMLPIYVDHILHPTITDAGFVTEVHHIKGDGEDAGVVYSEMQARENTAGDLMQLRQQRLIYPTTSAYRSETGGLMSALRALTAQQIRDYHSSYYVPHNLCLFIDGAVDLPELFHVLNSEVEPLILANRSPLPGSSSKHAPDGWMRPFVETSTSKPLSIPDNRKEIVEFMEEDESMGEISVAWLGPSPTDYLAGTALHILSAYLTASATAPLQKEFVEIPEPYASYIGFNAADRVNKNELGMYMADVPSKHLDTLPDLVKGKLRKIVEQEGIDMVRMAMILRMEKRKLLEVMETNMSSALAEAVIGDFLYADLNGKQLPLAFDDLADYEQLESWTGHQWKELLEKYYVSQPSVTVIGKPSAALAAKIESDEKSRLAARKTELGEEKLKDLQKVLEDAKAESDRPPPEDMINSFPLTNPKELSWVPVETAINNAKGQKHAADNGSLQRRIDRDGAALPYEVHFAQVSSNFISVSVLVDTLNIPSHLRPYMSIVQNALFKLPVGRADGTRLSFEEVVDQLNNLTVSQSGVFSFRSCFSETFVISLKVEKDQYAEAVAWIRDLFTGVLFTPARIEVIVAKMVQELPYEKRQGENVARATVNKLVYDSAKSTSESCGMLNALEFLPKVALALKQEDPETIRHLEELQQFLLDPTVMRVSVRGDISDVAHPRTVLRDNFLPIQDPKELEPMSSAADTLTELGLRPALKCALVPMSAIEGSYSHHYARGPVGWLHPDLPALQMAAAVLNATESYLWRSIRGNGLAYGASVEVDAESGLVEYSVYRSPNAMEAYKVAGELLRGLADGSVELEQNIVDGARASMTYTYARQSETAGAAASRAYLNEVLKGVGKDYDHKLLAKFATISLDEIREAIRKYFVPLFSPETSVCAISVNAGKADEVEQLAKELGYQVERHELPVLGGEEDGESGSDEGNSESYSEDESMSEGSDGRK